MVLQGQRFLSKVSVTQNLYTLSWMFHALIKQFSTLTIIYLRDLFEEKTILRSINFSIFTWNLVVLMKAVIEVFGYKVLIMNEIFYCIPIVIRHKYKSCVIDDKSEDYNSIINLLT